MPTVDRAAVVRKQLFERYDKLNSLWEKAEEQLTKLHIPRPIFHVYHSYQPDDRFPGYYCHCLGLQRVKGKWRICHGEYYDNVEPFEPSDWTPIVECSAEIRVAAASHLDDLRAELLQSSEKFVPEVDDAIAALSKSLAASDKSASRVIAKAKT